MTTVTKFLAILIGTMLLIPGSAFAEDVPVTTTSADSIPTTVEVTPTKPVPTLYRQNAPTPVRIASSTKPLPKELEARMQVREQVRDCAGEGSTTDCVQGAMQDREERRVEARERMEEKRSEILKRLSEQMSKRMEAAIERITKLADRVDSRIQKLKEQGVDTTKSEELVKTTRAKITEARAAVEAARGEVGEAAVVADTSTGSTKPVDAGKPIRESLEKARAAVTAAHKALVSAIESLKASSALRTKEAPAATSAATGL